VIGELPWSSFEIVDTIFKEIVESFPLFLNGCVVARWSTWSMAVLLAFLVIGRGTVLKDVAQREQRMRMIKKEPAFDMQDKIVRRQQAGLMI
jgi:hypothetical protein